MAVLIGSARIDENGNARNGRAGDQNGKEVSSQNWYLHKNGWVVVRAKDPTIREKIAYCMQSACDNNNIGYDQAQRETLYNIAKNFGFDCSKVNVAVETDCSALVRVCLAYAGISVGNFVTSNEVNILNATGLFDVYTDVIHCSSSDYLVRGDILVTAVKAHTAVVLSNGAKAQEILVANTTTTTSTSTTKKSVAEIAQEVLDGKWGNGEERKIRLTSAGYSYTEVQLKVNELVKAKQNTSSTPQTTTTLTGTSNNEDKIWNYLMSKIGNAYGVAGLMGNIKAESGCNPKNLQNSYEKKLGMNDEQYTQAVDNGTYTNFVRDSAGYGLVQWTFWSLKQDLLTYVKERGKSIGDLDIQLEFLVYYLSTKYKPVWEVLKSATTVLQASNEVLLKFERPADQSVAVQNKRASYGQEYYNKYSKTTPVAQTTTQTTTTQQNAQTQTSGVNVPSGNSSLAKVVNLSPNHSGKRTHAVDTITPHCFVGQVTAERGLEVFLPSSKQASCNYVIGKDGKIGLGVEEKNRSWCTSSGANDQRAITMELASDTTAPYAMTDAVYNSFIELCVDICKRYGKNKLIWFGDKDKSLNYTPASNEMIITVHRWFANKACPGEWLYSRLGNVASTVTSRLGGTTTTVETQTTTTTTQDSQEFVVKNGSAKPTYASYKDNSISGTYKVTASALNLRVDSKKDATIIGVMSKGSKVRCYGYYNKDSEGVRWYYVAVGGYTGFCSSKFLEKC